MIQHISAGEIPEGWLYSFFNSFGNLYLDPKNIDTNFLGIDLLAKKNIILTLLAGILTFLQMKLTMIAKPTTPSIPGANAPDMNKMMGFMNVFLVFMISSVVYSMQS